MLNSGGKGRQDAMYTPTRREKGFRIPRQSLKMSPWSRRRIEPFAFPCTCNPD
jgi:hypothetical protein